ncbi:MAG: 50S ribosomal protein L1 [Deltaproteobacteria bacterium]|uniref:Large ribosomal subunit protein uL1 n=1 Tax=Candidatus Zymogenus saltonus TaxID=2844893 RepID=A0A9D8PKK5_9DELT|nr:50S ribosomal protein L1 [Candidatus Zymogenus saltonus]
MAKRGKNYLAVKAKIDAQKRYDLNEALDILVNNSKAKFDESVDIAFRLGVNPRHSDQMVRGAAALPNGTGKSVKILVFAKGEKEREAKDAGADFVGAEDMIEKIEGGWLEFDKAVATPDLMGQVSKLGKLLGPRGLMPNAKIGTVTFDLKRAIEELKAGKVDFKVEKNGILHVPVGKVSFGVEKLKENIMALLEVVIKLKPQTSKGTYLKGIAVSSTMGPGLKIDPIYMRNILK